MGAAAMAVWHAIPTDWLYAVVGWFAAQWTYSWREHEKRRADERTRRTALVAELDWTRWAIAGFMIAIARGQPNVQPRILPILRWADAEQRRRGFQPLGFAELDDAQLVEKVAKLKPHGLSEARSLPTPVLDAVADDYGTEARVLKFNVDDDPNVAVKYGVRGIPTLILFRNGKEAGRLVGSQDKHQIEELIGPKSA